MHPRTAWPEHFRDVRDLLFYTLARDLVEVRTYDHVRCAVDAGLDEARELSPIVLWYFFEGDDWDEGVDLGCDFAEEVLETVL